uniref:Protein kinase domain-containing protein n=1 Tax=Anopheles quadriannulatus TaxID=34691 RepID=A0A182X6V9_ANOQN
MPAVTDPRDGRRVALKKLPNVFQSLVSSKRVFRELKMLCFFKHENHRPARGCSVVKESGKEDKTNQIRITN